MSVSIATVVKVVQHSRRKGTTYYMVVCMGVECTYVQGPEVYMRADQLRTAHLNLHAGLPKQEGGADR